MIWRCPRCKGPLDTGSRGLACAACSATYECVGDIPDLRLSGPSWIDHQNDRAQAHRLLEEAAGLSLEDTVRHVFSSRPDWDEARIALRTRQVMAGPERLRADLAGWLQPCVSSGDLFLDLGCGGGSLLAAAAANGKQGVGIDVSMVWLVVASRAVVESGGRPLLAAAMAEALPLADHAVTGVVSLDVIEHVNDPGPYLREIERVTAPGGHIALATPNRFSLTAEPHVSVWGVGWLPRRLQKRYVMWRTGRPYDFTCLLSTWEAARLVRRLTLFDCRILIPTVPDEEIAHFGVHRARLARLFNRLVLSGWFYRPFLLVCPFFRLVGIRRQE
jgi:2-polyprenyl-3-methyl-5-hydroxy-6-metoxy-1,4-benzoquinol methylase